MPHLSPKVEEVTLSLMAGLDCPRSLTVAILIRYGEWDQLFSLEVDPSHHSTADSYFVAVQATNFLSKLESLEETNKEKQVREDALSASTTMKWYWAEHECFKTNLRLTPYLPGNRLAADVWDSRIAGFIAAARREVFDMIGPGPKDPYNGAFGPGATVSDRSQACTIPDKMSSDLSLTTSAASFLPAWTQTAWGKAFGQLGRDVSFTRGNVYFTVPKKFTSRRSCGKEPSLNSFYQLGLGRDMRKGLKQYGIDLKDGQTVHRRVACSGSLTGEVCTIDLTSASDCKARVLVELFLPRRWYSALDSLRSPVTTFPAGSYGPNGEKTDVLRHVRLEKFSSMGNGFTFELETCIFAAIVAVTLKNLGLPAKAGRDFFVYGDDIIVNTHAGTEVVQALKFFGFTPNVRKTFLTGNFRESCGGDYFLGTAVRPYQLKELPNEPQHWIALANGIRRMALQNSPASILPLRFRNAWFKCLDQLPSAIKRCRGPSVLGDIVIHDEESRWDTRTRSSIRYVRCYRPAVYRKVRWSGFAYDVQFASALYGVSLMPNLPYGRGRLDSQRCERNRYLVPRDGVTGYKVGYVPYS